MGTIVVETFIARPPEQVFAYLRDISNQAQWQSEHVSEVIVEPPEPARVGTLYHKVRRAPFGTIRFTGDVADVASGRWLGRAARGRHARQWFGASAPTPD